MSKQPKETTTTTKSEPWAEAKPYYNNLYKMSEQALAETNKNPYTGPLTAAQNVNQTQAVDRLANNNFAGNNAALQQGVNALGGLAGKVGNYQAYGDFNYNPNDSTDIRTAAGKVNSFADDLASGKWLDPATNPYLKTNVDTALGQASDAWQRSINPTLQDAAIQSGAYGGSRNGIATGLAASEVGKTQQQTAAQMYGANYEAERQRMMQAPSLYGQYGSMLSGAAGLDQTNYTTGLQGHIADANAQNQAASTAAGLYQTQAGLGQAINQAELASIQAQAAAGQQQQAWQQAQNDDEYLRYQMNQQAPWTGIPEMLSVLTGGGFQTSASTGANPNYRSPFQQVLGGLGTVAGILGTPWTGGASLGATMFCDRRFKEDIEELGPDPETGIPLYAFRYRGDPKHYPKVIGPMAQDLEEIAPWMVVEVNGIKLVRTDRAL